MGERMFPEDRDWLLPRFRQCRGFYQCPKDGEGNRLGPLVAYAGKDEEGKNYVGEAYFNYAKVEEQPQFHDIFTAAISRLMTRPRFNIDVPDRVFGMPMGGLFLSCGIAKYLSCISGFMEKLVLQVKTDTSREVSSVIFGRHEPEKGDKIVLVEDVVNNFSTTGEAINVCLQKGVRVLAIVCAVNRSWPLREEYLHDHGKIIEIIPVVAAITAPTPQWRQSDPEVAADIIAGNVVWKPKLEWSKLEAAMAAAEVDESVQPEDDSHRAEGPSYGERSPKTSTGGIQALMEQGHG